MDPALQRPRVQALRHVSYQDGRGINAVGPDFHIVRQYPRPLDCEIAIQAYILQAAARSYVQSRSEEHTSELQSLMRISYAVFCLKKKKSSNTMPSQPNTLH